ncbi:unnamed protein product, partial [Urochloa humidicola]
APEIPPPCLPLPGDPPPIPTPAASPTAFPPPPLLHPNPNPPMRRRRRWSLPVARALRLAGAAASRVDLASDGIESLGAAVHEQLASASPAMGSSPSLPCPPLQIHPACRPSPSHSFVARPQPPNRIRLRFHLRSPLISARAAHLPSPRSAPIPSAVGREFGTRAAPVGLCGGP